jgi:hypothetical protein
MPVTKPPITDPAKIVVSVADQPDSPVLVLEQVAEVELKGTRFAFIGPKTMGASLNWLMV